MGEQYERFADVANGRDDAPAGDALTAARREMDNVLAPYLGGDAFALRRYAEVREAYAAAARAEGAAEREDLMTIATRLRQAHDAYFDSDDGSPTSVEPYWRYLAAAIRARSPSSGTEAGP